MFKNERVYTLVLNTLKRKSRPERARVLHSPLSRECRVYHESVFYLFRIHSNMLNITNTHTPLGKNGHGRSPRPNVQAAPQSGFCSLALQDSTHLGIVLRVEVFEL